MQLVADRPLLPKVMDHDHDRGLVLYSCGETSKDSCGFSTIQKPQQRLNRNFSQTIYL